MASYTSRTSGEVSQGLFMRALRSYVPLVCFALALATDVAYWMTSDITWANFSAWLLLAGVILAVLSAVLCVVGLLSYEDAGERRLLWSLTSGYVVVLILASFNNLVHAADGWTSVVPWGLALSAVTVAVLAVIVWLEASATNIRGARI